ncbi:4Fe-4S dicluster domain-containing protein [Burkholderia sp. LA-2-3-30-S1-D2]|uniref:4Fe-4S dicluster domain-containing protein n=1 Tax=Burkholderia sp. LA-2-3-30-S1-D2 TaxID=1637862 RepID=UPI000758505F|nr:4Fe-4S dicluster domain-containing protein [Burkholderia sp. LA-2-3-30-S1-D2]AOI95235.1 sulfite reductase subunit A [Burkholderia sp. LA-2-3-30-S1-D2]KVE19557.1 sulfite reductase subunit A [Burkholderia sp. LA-2-3-30-S1-D2]
MVEHPLSKGDKAVITREALQSLIDVLVANRYLVMGPTVRDGAIVYDRVSSVPDLPIGWTDHQEAGRYHLERRNDAALFGFAVGPHSWKRFLHPPVQTLWEARTGDDGLTITTADEPSPKFAFIGVRSCEIHAIAIQDRVFCEGPYPDPVYSIRRHDAFIVAVNCAQAAGTCFCVSMQTGPRAESGFDLALTELLHESTHEFLVEVGTPNGAEVLSQIPHRPASDAHCTVAEAVVTHTAAQMGRSLETDGIKELLQRNPNHPRWDEVADRCLSCGNCTMVCPTCFCTTIEDHSDLAGQSAGRVRKWDSCFTMDFSYIHGGSVRKTARSRYRQWMTHKLASWIDQFGTSGCVGCGRCITWCPVGIDITEEAAAIRATRTTARENEHGGA